MPRKPNLFLIGAMKSGTSSLHNYLAEHPEIFMSPVKEPMYFSRPESWSAGDEEYARLFAGASDETHVGESSTEYSKRPFRSGVPQRLFEYQPRARLIYVMRHPFERIVSQYKHMVTTGREARPLSEALKDCADYLTNSYYAYQLRPYLELFGAEAIFFDTFEALVAEPKGFCRRLFAWLGVDESFIPASAGRVYNASPAAVVGADDGPPIRWPALRRLILSFRSAQPRRLDIDFASERFRSDVEAVRGAVQGILRGWIDELEEMTGRSFGEWNSPVGPRLPFTLQTHLSEEITRSLRQVLSVERD